MSSIHLKRFAPCVLGVFVACSAPEASPERAQAAPRAGGAEARVTHPLESALWFSEAAAWRIVEEAGDQRSVDGVPGDGGAADGEVSEGGGVDVALELLRRAAYTPPHRSPHSLALVAPASYEEFELELELLSTTAPYGHRDLCLVLGFQDPAHFYYVHLATTPDEHAHNVFLVDGGDRRRLAAIPAEGVEWGEGEWHRVKCTRDASGLIRVWFDDMETPVLEVVDTTFGRGHVGWGSFDDTGRFANVRLRGEALVPRFTEDPFQK